jgi:hypothetical protein
MSRRWRTQAGGPETDVPYGPNALPANGGVADEDELAGVGDDR